MDEAGLIKALKALADKKRIRMAREIASAGELSCGRVKSHFHLSQPTISHHLAILRRHGLVQSEPRGKEVYYRMDQENVTECCGILMSRFSVVLNKDIEVR